MSTLVHTDQICKYVGFFSTRNCPKLNYLRKRRIGGKNLWVSRNGEIWVCYPLQGSAVGGWHSARHAFSRHEFAPWNGDIVPQSFYFMGLGAEKNRWAIPALLVCRQIEIVMQAGAMLRNRNNHGKLWLLWPLEMSVRPCHMSIIPQLQMNKNICQNSKNPFNYTLEKYREFWKTK